MKVHGEDGHCSWYGECGPSPTGKYNCKYTGPAIPMTNQTGLKILKTYCPDLIDGEWYLSVNHWWLLIKIIMGEY